MAAHTSPRRSPGRRVRTNNRTVARDWYVPPTSGSAALAPDTTREWDEWSDEWWDEWLEPHLDESVVAEAAHGGAPFPGTAVAAPFSPSIESPAWAGSDVDRLIGTQSSRGPIVLRVLLALAVMAVMLFTFFPAGVEADSAPLTTVPHVVQPGDTLWRLAEAHAPAGNDVRATIDQIKELNQLESSSLVVGDLLMLPAGG